MKNKYRFFKGSFLSGILITIAYIPVTSAESIEETLANRIKSEMAKADATLASPLSAPTSEQVRDYDFSFSANKEDKEASLTMYQSSGDHAYQLQLSTSTKKDTPLDTPATFDGLSSGSTFKVGYTWSPWKPELKNNAEDILQAICKAHWLEANPGKEYDPFAAGGCSNDVLKKPEYKKAFNQWARDNFSKEPIWMVSVDSAINQNTYKYLDANNLNFAAAEKDTHINRNIGMRVAYYDMVDRDLISAGYKYEEKYKGQDANQLCLDIGNNNLSCQSIAIGEPTMTRHRKIFVEYRILEDTWAMSPMIWYDKETEKGGIEWPLYLARDKKNQFNGGIKLQWNDEDREGIVSFFITKPLTLTKPRP